VHLAPSLDWNALLMRSQDPVVADPNLRQAIAHAIDRSKLAEAVTLGISKANPSAISQTNHFHTAVQNEGPEYNPELAKRYLRQSHYRGQTILLTTNRRFQHMFDNAIYIQAMLREVGIDVELDVTEWSTQLSRYFAGDFQLMAFGYSARTDPVLAYKSFVGDQGKDSWAQWTSHDADRLLGAAITETRPDQRQRLFDELHRLMLHDLPILPLFNHYVIQASSKRVTGFKPWTANRVRVWGVQLQESSR
jgi:peptide/nickel transport system substrate-binding protein